jgi:preprotein translocase subunit YajC
MKAILKFGILAAFYFVSTMVQAQCAMCRTQVVNNVSQGDVNLAAGLNTGIIYLFVMPYIAIGVIAFLWYRNSKVNEHKKSIRGNY